MANQVGPTDTSVPFSSIPFGGWALAFAGLWFVLIMFVDFGATAELAAALAALIAASATVVWLPSALANFQKVVQG